MLLTNQADYRHLERLAARTDRLPSLRAKTKRGLMEEYLGKAKGPGDLSAHSLALQYCKVCFRLTISGDVPDACGDDRMTYLGVCEGGAELRDVQLNLEVTFPVTLADPVMSNVLSHFRLHPSHLLLQTDYHWDLCLSRMPLKSFNKA